MKACEWCETPESTRNGRRFCSWACRQAYGNRPEPTKVCQVCGTEFGRATYGGGVQENRKVYAKRTLCANPACKAEMMLRKAFRLNPHMPGDRPVLARSCDDCGAFFTPGKGQAHWRCWLCRREALTPAQKEAFEERKLAIYHRIQEESRPGAERLGMAWTGPELELVATRTDLTTQELAALLGRTVAGVKGARHKVLNEPKWRQVAGVE